MEKQRSKQLTIKELREKLTECEKLKDGYIAGWQRQKADFLNFQREQAEVAEALRKTVHEKFVLDFLPIIDNIERAFRELPKSLENHEWIEGIKQIHVQSQKFIKSLDVEEVRTEGIPFNPEFHEVVQMLDMTDKDSGTIHETVQKGYTLHGKLIRPAKVKVIK